MSERPCECDSCRRARQAEWSADRKRQREAAAEMLTLAEQRRENILEIAAFTIYSLGRKIGRRFVSRNTVSRGKILRALHAAGRVLLLPNPAGPIEIASVRRAIYRVFDRDANAREYRDATAGLKRWDVSPFGLRRLVRRTGFRGVFFDQRGQGRGGSVSDRGWVRSRGDVK